MNSSIRRTRRVAPNSKAPTLSPHNLRITSPPPLHFTSTRPPKLHRPPTINKNVRPDGETSHAGDRAPGRPTYLIQYRLPAPNDPPTDPNRSCSNSICRMAPIGTSVYLQESLEPNCALNNACCLSAGDMTTSRPPTIELYAHKFSRLPKRKRPKPAPGAIKVTTGRICVSA